jgi:hypothetical protein
MITHTGLLAIFLILIALAVCLFFNYRKGLCLAAFFLVVLPNALMLEVAGNLPNFPATRLIVIIVFAFWLFGGKRLRKVRDTPFLYLLLLFGGTGFLSLLFSVDFSNGSKDFLSFTFEILMFFIIIQTSIQDRNHGMEILESIWLGLSLVAILGVIERHYGWNPMTWAVPNFEPKNVGDVRSTYPHRILFGTAVAMGFPIALALSFLKRRGKWKYILSAGALVVACYFSFSRGPWMGIGVALCVILLLGSTRQRNMILVIFLLVLFVLAVRPGVWRTLRGSYTATMDEDSFKGGTYQYRWELWGVAYNEISNSPLRLLLGMGGIQSVSCQGQRRR